MLYTVTMRARKLGAIGAFYAKTDTVDAANKRDAVHKFIDRHRDKWETAGAITVVSWRKFAQP